MGNCRIKRGIVRPSVNLDAAKAFEYFDSQKSEGLSRSYAVLSYRHEIHPRLTAILVINEEIVGWEVAKGRVKSRKLRARHNVTPYFRIYRRELRVAFPNWSASVRLKRLPLDWMPGATKVVKKV